MTAFELAQAKVEAERVVGDGGSVQFAIYKMLLVLLQNEADKAAARRTDAGL